MLALGLRGIDSVGYWVDEFYTLNAVRGGFGETLGEIPYLPYYTVVWLATGGGSCLTETCLRYPSALAMAAAVLVTAFTARRLSNRWGGFAAGLLLALAPGIQRYAHDARPYALGVLLVCLATMFLAIGTTSPSRWPWVGYAASIIGIGVVLPVGLAVIPAHAVILGMTLRPLWGTAARRWLWALAACTPVFLFGAWLLMQYSFLKERVGDVMVIHPINMVQGVTWITSGGAGEAALYGIFAGAILILALWSRSGMPWLIGAGAGVASIWLVSVGPMIWWQGRSLVPLAGILAVGAGLTLASTPRSRYAAALILLFLLVIPFYTWNRLPWSRGYDYRQAAGIVDSRWVVGDRIDPGAQLPWVVQWALEHYTPEGSRFLDETSPLTGRVWVFGGDAPCSPAAEWDLGIGNTLYLCETGRTD